MLKIPSICYAVLHLMLPMAASDMSAVRSSRSRQLAVAAGR